MGSEDNCLKFFRAPGSAFHVAVLCNIHLVRFCHLVENCGAKNIRLLGNRGICGDHKGFEWGIPTKSFHRTIPTRGRAFMVATFKRTSKNLCPGETLFSHGILGSISRTPKP